MQFFIVKNLLNLYCIVGVSYDRFAMLWKVFAKFKADTLMFAMKRMFTKDVT